MPNSFIAATERKAALAPCQDGQVAEVPGQQQAEHQGVEHDLDGKRPVRSVDPRPLRPQHERSEVIAAKPACELFACDEPHGERDRPAHPHGGPQAEQPAAQEAERRSPVRGIGDHEPGNDEEDLDADPPPPANRG
jgi:hypothetical protein